MLLFLSVCLTTVMSDVSPDIRWSSYFSTVLVNYVIGIFLMEEKEKEKEKTSLYAFFWLLRFLF